MAPRLLKASIHITEYKTFILHSHMQKRAYLSGKAP